MVKKLSHSYHTTTLDFFFLSIHSTINPNLHCGVNYTYFLQECLEKELLPSEEILMGKGV